MDSKYTIAVIAPLNRGGDHTTNTILDGLFLLSKEREDLDFRYTKPYKHQFSHIFSLRNGMEEKKFISFAQNADLILLCFGKYGTNVSLAERINCWDKTAYIDGSELGKDRRYDKNIQQQLLNGTYTETGGINIEMKKRCALYFRRERPYINGIIPLPFGIESRYIKYFREKKKKDIDFVSIFGQSVYPALRREVTEHLEAFCKENNFTCKTERTRTIPFINKGTLFSKKFYKILARAKVGISVGGGGFDTGRFWEILGNNCLLLTERIAIFPEGGSELNYKRIHEFDNLEGFKRELTLMADYLKTQYNQKNLTEEYNEILEKHSTKARVITIIEEAEKIGLF